MQIVSKQLFRFCDKNDILFIIFGTIFAIFSGISLPAYILLSQQIVDGLLSQFNMHTTLSNHFILFVLLGLFLIISNWIMFSVWMITGNRQINKCKQNFFISILSQETQWFDKNNQLATMFQVESANYRDALGEKVPEVLCSFSTIIIGITISFWKGWKQTLISLCVLPLLLFSMGLSVYWYQQILKSIDQNYIKGGQKASEVISSIKTIKALNGEIIQKNTFQNLLDNGYQSIKSKIIFTALAYSTSYLILFSSYSLGYWYGAKNIGTQNQLSAGKILAISMLIFQTVASLGQVSRLTVKVLAGAKSAEKISAIIDRIPRIIQGGIELHEKIKIIEFQNVSFAYPCQSSKLVLNGISFKLNLLESNAIVGQSGCGKSTILQLILRFYDPQQGVIKINGIDLKQINIKWLRDKISYVSQQPILFGMTIKQNLMLTKSNANDEQILEALKKAEAFDFVMNLQNKLDTEVGLVGNKLSGGQKQRLAIARALIRKPQLLLLDQATSALDLKNENLIIKSINRISKQVGLITVAHRIRTIMDYDNIFVINQGKIKQYGILKNLNYFKNRKIEQFKVKKDEQTLYQQQIDTEMTSSSIQLSQQQNNQFKINHKSLLETLYSQLDFIQYIKDMMLCFLLVIFIILTGTVFTTITMVLGIIQTRIKQIQNKLHSVQQMQILIVLLLILGLIHFICYSLETIFAFNFSQRIKNRFRTKTLQKIMKLRVEQLDDSDQSISRLLNLLNEKCGLIGFFLSNVIVVILRSLTCSIVVFTYSFYFDSRIALIFLSILPLVILIIYFQNVILQSLYSQNQKINLQISQILIQSILNIKTVIAYNLKHSLLTQYHQMSIYHHSKTIHQIILGGLFYGLKKGLLLIIYSLLFYIFSSQIIKHNIDPTNIIICFCMTMFTTQQIILQFSYIPGISACKNAYFKVSSFLKKIDESELNDQHKKIKQIKNGIIQFSNVSFKYPKTNKLVLSQINMKLYQKKKIAIIGKSGCGKSTLIQLLLRFYDVTQGQILIDGINIIQYDIYFLRKYFAYVNQQPILLNMSIYENIVYGLDQVSIDQVRKAAAEANALKFIEEDKNGDGFNKMAGVRGSKLSGGERQRIALARSIIRNGKYLLLDEATCGLDEENERMIKDCLRKLCKNIGCIEITHKIQNLDHDRIYVIDEGRIVEQGGLQIVGLKNIYFNLIL